MIKVLIVEDELQLLHNIASYLTTLGGEFEVLTAPSGEHGLKILENDANVDILLTDVRLPGIDGIELVHQTVERWPKVRIIVMTAFPSSTVRERTHHEGALHFIEKPLDLEALPEILREVSSRPERISRGVGGLDILEVAEFLMLSGETKVIKFQRGSKGGTLVFENGAMVYAATGDFEGPDAFFEMSLWGEGLFEEVLGAETRKYPENVNIALVDLLKEAAALLQETNEKSVPLAGPSQQPASPTRPASDGDEEIAETTVSAHDSGEPVYMNHSSERIEKMEERSSTDVLEDLLKVPDVNAAVVIGRDGFVIETAGGSANIEVDNLGASLAHAVNGIEEMGTELGVKNFQDLFIEFGRAVIMCRPVGDAVVAIVTPDPSKLGIVRHKSKKIVAELSQYF